MTDPTPPVVFNYTTFTTLFPEMAGLSSGQAQAYFLQAGLYFQNTTANPGFCNGIDWMTMMAYLVTAHIAMLRAPKDANGFVSSTGAAASPLVGRINSASEGSVSVGVELKGGGSPSEEFFTQTQYGFDFWQATAQYRTMRYAAQPTFVPSSRFLPFGLRRFGGW